jgi:hypothetical protein
MKQLTWLLLASALSGCLSPGTPAELGTAGKADAPTAVGVLRTDASAVRLPDGTTGWLITCDEGLDFKGCESRAKSLCSKGFKTLNLRQGPSKSAFGMEILIMPTGDGTGDESVAGFRPYTQGAVDRTALIRCVE